jgi:hypothetical protein
MALLDDLKGILSPAEFAKIEGNSAVATRLARGQELIEYWDGDSTTPPATVTEPPPARSTPPPVTGQFDLSAIDRMLDAKLGKINETVDARIADVVKTRGDELVNNAVKISITRADELNRIYGRHEREVGTPFDSADFTAFLEKPEVKARGYRSITDAYNDYVAPVVQQKTIEKGIADGIKARSGSSAVPGTTPPPATNSNIRMFINRGKTSADGTPTTGAGRAAAALDRLQARQVELAS